MHENQQTGGTMSRQPTHHGYAVNVKDDELYSYDSEPLSETAVQALYDVHVEAFWGYAEEIAADHHFTDVYSEGRMGGYAVPQPQPTDEWSDEEITEWLGTQFRPFESDILAAMAHARECFLEELAEAVDRAKREPAERAYWEARDVVTVES